VKKFNCWHFVYHIYFIVMKIKEKFIKFWAAAFFVGCVWVLWNNFYQSSLLKNINKKTKEKIASIFDNKVECIQWSSREDVFALFITVDEDWVRYKATEKGVSWIDNKWWMKDNIVGISADDFYQSQIQETKNKIMNFFCKVSTEAWIEDRVVVYVEWHGEQTSPSADFSVWSTITPELMENMFSRLDKSTNLLVIWSCWSWSFKKTISCKDNLLAITSSEDDNISIWNNSGERFFTYHIFNELYNHAELPISDVFDKSKNAYIKSNPEWKVGCSYSYPWIWSNNEKLKKTIY